MCVDWLAANISTTCAIEAGRLSPGSHRDDCPVPGRGLRGPGCRRRTRDPGYRVVDELGEQPRLAHLTLAADDHHPAGPVGDHVVEPTGQPTQLIGATHELHSNLQAITYIDVCCIVVGSPG
jgi:hypothetical protein